MATTNLDGNFNLRTQRGVIPEYQIDGSPISISNREVINSASDFPDAVAGVITLVASTEYYIGGTDVDIGTNRIQISANNAVSGSASASKLTSSTTAALFTGGDVGLFVVQDVGLDVPNGAVFDIQDTVPGTTTTVLNTTRTFNCASVGTFEDVFGVNFSNNSFINSTQGLTLKGNNNVISMRQLAIISASVSFKGVDFGTSVSPTIEFDDYLVIAPAGAFGISGLANNGNVTSGSIASVGSSEFLAGATALENITVDDIRWNFLANSGIPDTNPDALLDITGNATETVIAVIDTPVLVNATWVVASTSHFTGTTGGRATYDGERDLSAPVDISATIEAASGAGKNITAYVALNGTVVAAAKAVAKVGANDPRSISIPWQIAFTETDFVEMFVENNTDTVNLVVTDAILRIR